MTALHLLAHAKINLGLEVLGKREDGFHELRTVMQSISLADRLELSSAESADLIVDDPDLAGSDNLVAKAMAAYEQATGRWLPMRIRLRKRIPAAAGLGGASSDAAATLRGLQRLHAGHADLLALAASLGSDVPFFLVGGAALAEGRGERLTPLPSLASTCGISIVPEIVIPRKTATLYGALTPGDFSDGACATAVAAALSAHNRPDDDLLANAFSSALTRIVPEIATLQSEVRRITGRAPLLSGAGPSHYLLCANLEEAGWLADDLRSQLRGPVAIYRWRPVAGPGPMSTADPLAEFRQA